MGRSIGKLGEKTNLERVFNSRVGCFHSIHKLCNIAKLANLELKSRPEQLLGYLPLAFSLMYERDIEKGERREGET